jgi:hypothetical protein
VEDSWATPARSYKVSTSVADPTHFGVDSDPDPRIHASD